MSNRDKIHHVSLIILLPFVVSAVWEFMPRWVALPSTLVGAMLWFGTCALVMDEKESNT